MHQNVLIGIKMFLKKQSGKTDQNYKTYGQYVEKKILDGFWKCKKWVKNRWRQEVQYIFKYLKCNECALRV